MKLSNIYEQAMNDLHFEEVDSKGMIYFNLMKGNNTLGYIHIGFIPNGYHQFEEFMSEEEYLELFRSDSFYEIEHVEVGKEYGGKGYGKMLMKKALEKIKSKGGKAIYLNASPIKHETLGLSDLVKFYGSFGFEEIPETEPNEDNIEMVKRL
jgi:GNAT superfamily N-acetyltransferase